MKKIYKERIDRYKGQVQQLRERGIWFSTARLAAVVMSLLGGYLYLDSYETFWIILCVLGVALFLFLLARHTELRRKKKHRENIVLLNQRELKYVQGGKPEWPDGSVYRDPDHLYTHDLDIFGAHSLFAHLTRTVTLRGAARLGQVLADPDRPGVVPARQEAIKELASELDWRHHFTASGMEVEEDPKMKEKIARWLDEKEESASALLINPVTRVILASTAIGLGLYFVLSPTAAHFNWFMYAFGINLILVFSQFKFLRREHKALNGIAPSLQMYGELLAAMEKTDFKSAELAALRNRLKTGEGKASGSLKKLGRLLNGFDQTSNVVALLLTNGLYLYHLHVLQSLYKWKRTHGKEIHDWIEVVGEMDHLVSLGNFAANYPEYTYPELAEEPAYEGEEVGHPLISRAKRVSNSFSLEDFKYMVLTGSNMSGKSTFLKTLGVNLVLARAGAPVCAVKLRVYPFTLLSSMKLIDSLEREESYFQAEVLRLKSIRKVLDKGEPCLVLLDEILRGTNSEDKRNGTRLFMEKVGSSNAKGVIATHDIDIAELADKQPDVFRAYYFESKVVNDQLYFDYRLRKGICTTPNATDLMRAHGII